MKTRSLVAGVAVFSLALSVFVDSPDALATGCPTPVAPGGAGTEGSPWIIDSAAKLAWIGQEVDGRDDANRISPADNESPFKQRDDRLSGHYLQTVRLDLTGCQWSPIGVVWEDLNSAGNNFVPTAQPFSGVYDGGGFEISGLDVEITTAKFPAGLFALVGSAVDQVPATVKNLTLDDVTVTNSRSGAIFDLSGLGSNPTGALAGIIGLKPGKSDSFNFDSDGHARIENVHVTGSVASSFNLDGQGGLVGWAIGVSAVIGSSSRATVSSDGGVSSAARKVGGLIGRVGSGVTVLKSYASGEVVTRNNSGPGMSGDDVGGLVGLNAGAILYSYASGDVTGSSGVGGLAGELGNNLQQIKNSYSVGNVFAGAASPRAGGLVGEVRFTPSGNVLERNYSSGSVTRNENSDSTRVGAFGGDPFFDATQLLLSFTKVKDNFFDSSKDVPSLAIANTDPEGASRVVTGRSTTELNSFNTFEAAGWAIVDGWAPFVAPDNGNAIQGTHQVWGICSGVNGGYPFLLWQYSSDPCAVPTQPGASNVPGILSPAIHLDLKAKTGDVVAGAPVLIEGQGLQPGSTYSLVMRSTPTTVTTGTVSGGGRFSTTVNLPAGIAPGNHTITLTAIGSDGSTLSLVTTFVVSSAGTFTSISPGVGSVVGGLAATGPNSSALSLGVASSLALLALGFAVFASSRRKIARVS